MTKRPARPGSSPKIAVDDDTTSDRMERLMASPAYVLADRDSAFLNREDMRHSRLGLEYLKVELALQEQNIESTIVLFGGTRIIEPGAAKQAVAIAEKAHQNNPNDAKLTRAVAIAKRILAKSHYYDVAREFATLVSESCCADAPNDFVVVTGGGPGIMEAGNRGAFDANRKTIDFNIDLPREQFPNPYITPDLCFQFR